MDIYLSRNTRLVLVMMMDAAERWRMLDFKTRVMEMTRHKTGSAAVAHGEPALNQGLWCPARKRSSHK